MRRAISGRDFGEAWTIYCRSVPEWLPRFRPWYRPDHPPARLFVAAGCGMCRGVAEWFGRREARNLAIVAAETHPSGTLRRITYEPGDGSRPASGVEAMARALEHIHLGWAFLGFLLRLPVVGGMAQLLADASGADLGALSRLPCHRANHTHFCFIERSAVLVKQIVMPH